MQNLTGTAGTADRFVITQKGSTITGFNYAEGDRIVLDLEAPGERSTSSETLTNFDIINPLIGQAATAGVTGYDSPLKATAAGVEVRIPAASGIHLLPVLQILQLLKLNLKATRSSIGMM
jgi:hypothetical protein